MQLQLCILLAALSALVAPAEATPHREVHPLAACPARTACTLLPFVIDHFEREVGDRANARTRPIRISGRFRTTNEPAILVLRVRMEKGVELDPMLPYRGMSPSLRQIVLTDAGPMELDPYAASALPQGSFFVIDTAREMVIGKFIVGDAKAVPYLTFQQARPRLWERRGRLCISSPSFDKGEMTFDRKACVKRNLVNGAKFDRGTKAQTEMALKLIPALEAFAPSDTDHLLIAKESGSEFAEVSRQKNSSIVIVQMKCDCE